MSPNRALAIIFAVVAVLQTAIPIVVQKLTRAIVYHELFRATIAACVLAAIVVALCQALRPRFGTAAMIIFYIGLALLVAFDIWIEFAIGASC